MYNMYAYIIFVYIYRVYIGHGKTYISRNAAAALVGEDNYYEVACGSIRDDAYLFGSNLGGGKGGTYSSKGQLVEWLRERQGRDVIVFLDEFEKIQGLTSALGWDQVLLRVRLHSGHAMLA